MADNRTFSDIIARAYSIIERYEKIEGKPWQAEGAVIELTKQVGELAKLIMIHEGYYFSDRQNMHPGYEVSTEKIADELADIFRCTLRIAKYYNIDFLNADDQACKEDEVVLTTKEV